jgi:hypothetical protein
MRKHLQRWILGYVSLVFLFGDLIIWRDQLFAACQVGCAESNCWKNGAQCKSVNVTTAVGGILGGCCGWWADSCRGAVGGTWTCCGPNCAVWSCVPACSKECPKTYSRALNAGGMSTCSGSATNPKAGPRGYCAGS